MLFVLSKFFFFSFLKETFIGHSPCSAELISSFQPWLVTSLSVDGNGQFTQDVLCRILPFFPVVSHFSAQQVLLCGRCLHLLPRCLMSLKVAKTLVSSADLRQIDCPFLALIDASGCEKLTDSEFGKALLSWKKIASLYLSGCKHLTDTSVALVSTERLELMHVDGTGVSARLVKQLKADIPFLKIVK
jgi:hypothetical protein